MIINYYITDGIYLLGEGMCQEGLEKYHEINGFKGIKGLPPESIKKNPINTLSIEDEIKSQRNRLLSASDWTDLLSSYDRLGEVKYSEWQVYRQALRDITNQPGYPTDVKWPTAPS